MRVFAMAKLADTNAIETAPGDQSLSVNVNVVAAAVR
jgi:hypothetical protein